MESIIKCIQRSFKNPNLNQNQSGIQISRKRGTEQVNSVDWENFFLDIRNDMLRQMKLSYSYDGNQGWNEFARLYRENYSDDIRQFIKSYDFSDETVTSIAFDLGNTIIYKYIGEQCHFEFPFYEEMYRIYKSGYIPVGYIGDYPNGTFEVMRPQKINLSP